MDVEKIPSWQESVQHTYDGLVSKTLELAPQILGAIILVAIGLLIAYLAQLVVAKIVSRLDVLFRRFANLEAEQQEKVKNSYVKIISRVAFWAVLLFFLTAAAHVLGWRMVSDWMSGVVTYMPNFIAGLTIIIAGFLLGSGVKSAVVGMVNAAGMSHQETLSRIAQITVIFTALVIGVEQIGINVHFLTTVIVVIIGVLLGGAALAFSLGSKVFVENIIGSQCARKHCRIGERVLIGDYEGVVVEVTQTAVVLETKSGRTVVPAKYFNENICSYTTAEITDGIDNKKDEPTDSEGAK